MISIHNIFINSPAWHYTAVYNETQYDNSEDESDPASSDLESEEDDEDYFFQNSCAITRMWMHTIFPQLETAVSAPLCHGFNSKGGTTVHLSTNFI